MQAGQAASPGATLIIEGFDVQVPKGYICFAMAFSVAARGYYEIGSKKLQD